MNRRTLIAAAVTFVALLLGALLSRPDTPEPTTPTSTDTTTPSTATAVAPAGVPGPVDAAVAAVAGSQHWLYLTDDEIRSAVLDIATADAGPALADQTVAELATARADLDLSPGPVWWIVHPLATRIASADDTTARIEVWTVTVLSAVDIAAPQADWSTITVDLALENDQWRVEGLRDRPGPSPALGPHDQPWDAAPFAAGLDGFERLDGTTARKVPR